MSMLRVTFLDPLRNDPVQKILSVFLMSHFASTLYIMQGLMPDELPLTIELLAINQLFSCIMSSFTGLHLAQKIHFSVQRQIVTV